MGKRRRKPNLAGKTSRSNTQPLNRTAEVSIEGEEESGSDRRAESRHPKRRIRLGDGCRRVVGGRGDM